MTRPMVWGIRNTALVAKQHILTALTQCSWDTDTVPLSVSILASFALSLFSLTLFRYYTPKASCLFMPFSPFPTRKVVGPTSSKCKCKTPNPLNPSVMWHCSNAKESSPESGTNKTTLNTPLSVARFEFQNLGTPLGNYIHHTTWSQHITLTHAFSLQRYRLPSRVQVTQFNNKNFGHFIEEAFLLSNWSKPATLAHWWVLQENG